VNLFNIIAAMLRRKKDSPVNLFETIGEDTLADQSRLWMTVAKNAILDTPRGRYLDSDVIRSIAGDPPKQNAIGALLKWGVQSKVLKEVGRTTSERRETRGRKIRIYRVVA